MDNFPTTQFPFPERGVFPGHCSRVDLHSTCTGLAVAVCLPYRSVFAVGAGGFGLIFCTPVTDSIRFLQIIQV